MKIKAKDLVLGQVYWVIELSIYDSERSSVCALRGSFYWQSKGYEAKPMLCVGVQGGENYALEEVDAEKLGGGVVQIRDGGTYCGAGELVRAVGRRRRESELRTRPAGALLAFSPRR